VLPEQGQMLRVLDVPPGLVESPYGTLAARAREQGYLPLGLLDNTGSLYDRKQERIAEALRRPDYRSAVEALTSASRLVSNVPTLAPGPGRTVRAHAKLVVLLPTGRRQSADQMQRRQSQRNLPREVRPEHLLVCGWKPDMAELLAAILARHEAAGRPLAGLSVAGRMPEHEASAISHHKELAAVLVAMGEPTDPTVLRQAGIMAAHRVLVLSDPAPQTSSQEADARNVMVSFAVTDLNPAVYKCVEMRNPSFGEHLRVANVEEPVYTGEYQRLMLVQAALGTGLASALDALFDPRAARLQVVDFPAAPAGTSIAQHAEALAAQGRLLIGVMEHTGNTHIRKTEYVRLAQVQSGVESAVEHLRRLRAVQTNQPILNPEPTYLPGVYSRALVITMDSAA
jgi:voltage-gated potassium channel